MPIKAIATDYGSTISLPEIDHELGQKPVDPDAARTLRELHEAGIRLVLASNTAPAETRWPALARAGIDRCFSAVLLSYSLGVRKPDPLFYQLVITAAQARAEEIVFVGDHLLHDVVVPLHHGMHAALVRPDGLADGEDLPAGAAVIGHFRELPTVLDRLA